MSCKCANSPNLFCYVCGKFTRKPQKNSLSLQRRKRINYILAVKLGIRARHGHYLHVKLDVRNI